MLIAREAAAMALLHTPKDFSLHKRLEIRIWDSIQNGGTNIIYAGEITEDVIRSLRALGYTVTPMQYENQTRMYKISWEDIINASDIRRTRNNDSET